jgi:hypothetical protein
MCGSTRTARSASLRTVSGPAAGDTGSDDDGVCAA